MVKTNGLLQIDGVSTFNENLADNGGIAFALMAYKSWMKQSSHDYKERQKTMITQLNTTDAKLFFLAFAQVVLLFTHNIGGDIAVHFSVRPVIGSVLVLKVF